ncbi:MAG: WG repeat-containing protein [Rikenellaceae bacterium]|nr:WG repeat-containing protein [Rikenellaceae bacterium]
MIFPSVNNYIESLLSPVGRFRTLSGIIPERRSFEYPVAINYNDVVDFPVTIEGTGMCTLRCKLKGEPLNNIRNITTAKYIGDHKFPFLLDYKVLPEEILVFTANGQSDYYDIVIMERTDAETLDRVILKLSVKNDIEGLYSIISSLEELHRGLASCDFRHNNIKPSKILITGSKQAVLDDYSYACAENRNSSDLYDIQTITDFLRMIADNRLSVEQFSDFINDMSHIKKYISSQQKKTVYGGISSHNIVSEPFSGYQRNSQKHNENNKILCCGEFKEGLAIAKRNGLYGFISGSGQEIVPFIYDWVSDFEEGLAVVKIAESYGIVDKSGREVVPVIYEDICWSADNRLIYVLSNQKWRLLDRSGKNATRYVFDYVGDFHNDRTIVYKTKKYGFIDRDCKIVIPAIYDNVSPFGSNGLSKVEKNGRILHIDKNGNTV